MHSADEEQDAPAAFLGTHTLSAPVPEQYEDMQHESPGEPGHVSPLPVQTPALQAAEPQSESVLAALQCCPAGRQ